jgi:dipeptidyl aminopeptidase/acylaminoacyl peptidase
MKPQWSPNGALISYIALGDGVPNLFVMDQTGQKRKQITHSTTGVVSYQWSPDGKHIAYIAPDGPSEQEIAELQKSDAQVVGKHVHQLHLWVIDTESIDGETQERRLTSGDFSVLSFDWSADGRFIAFAHAPSAEDPDVTFRSDVPMLDCESLEITPVAGGPEAESQPKSSPDGQWIAYVKSDPLNSEYSERLVCVLSRTTGQVTQLAKTSNQSPTLIGWSGDSQGIYYEEIEGTTQMFGYLPVTGAPPERLSDDSALSVGGFSLNSSRQVLGYVGFGTSDPFEVYVSPTAQWAPRKITGFNDSLLDRPLGKTEVIRWKSTDGMEIEGLLTYPSDYEPGKRYPLLTHLHGGPVGAFTQTYIPADMIYPIAAFAADGYAVFRPNVRSSDGRGGDFRKANMRDWGGMDFQDMMTGIDHIVSLGVADPDRLGIMGWSYGGYMTAWSISRSDRFKAASVGAGPVDLVGMTACDLSELFLHYFGWYWDDYDTYVLHSPIRYVQNVQTPTLIQHGTEDYRVPVAQGLTLYNALRARGVPVEMVLYPRSGHVVVEPRLMVDVMSRNLTWFRKHIPAGGR